MGEPQVHIGEQEYIWSLRDKTHRITHRTRPHQLARPLGSSDIRLPYGRPICSRCLCCPSLCVKQFSEGADTVLSSREFQNFITLSEKKCWRI